MNSMCPVDKSRAQLLHQPSLLPFKIKNGGSLVNVILQCYVVAVSRMLSMPQALSWMSLTHANDPKLFCGDVDCACEVSLQ